MSSMYIACSLSVKRCCLDNSDSSADSFLKLSSLSWNLSHQGLVYSLSKLLTIIYSISNLVLTLSGALRIVFCCVKIIFWPPGEQGERYHQIEVLVK